MTARTALALLLAAPLAHAADWPQWMGPDRDNVWKEEGILEKFPAGGPKKVWSAPVAGGYAGPAVANGKVYVADYVTSQDVKVDNFGRKEFTGTERVLCLDEKTGQQLWKHEYPVKYTVSYPAGPRCTPTVHAGKVYTLGAEGHLICFKADTGEIVWQKALKDTYNTKSALWGYAAHPLIDGKKLITLAGGEGSHVIALDLDTGAEIWKSQSQPEQGYSPGTIVQAGGVRQLIVPGPAAVRALDPETGKRLWSEPYSASNGSIIMTAVKSGDYVFVGGYQNKNLLLELGTSSPTAKTVWKDKKGFGMSPVNVQPFLDGNVLYGFHENGEMMAVELPSGKRLWTGGGPFGDAVQGSGTAFLTKHGDRFFLFSETGELVIAKLSPEKYEEIDRAKVIAQTNTAFGRKVVWCAPAYANKRAYIRNDSELVCIDLAK